MIIIVIPQNRLNLIYSVVIQHNRTNPGLQLPRYILKNCLNISIKSAFDTWSFARHLF